MRRICRLPSSPPSRAASFRSSRVCVRAVTRTFEWSYRNQRFDVPYDVAGDGAGSVLCLPAINLASTRKEMQPLTQKLAPSVTSVVCDWPGFGDASRLNASYDPELLLTFVMDFIKEVMKKEKMPVVASGHASGYVLRLAQKNPSLFSHIALISPTYRSPAKAIGMPSIAAIALRGAFKTPLLGGLLYGRVIEPAFLKKQYESHVFADPSSITDAFLQDRHDTVNKPGGQYAPSHFFTGLLDVIQTREVVLHPYLHSVFKALFDDQEFIEVAQSVKCPLKVIYGERSPSGSLTEMQAMESSGLDVARLPGSLGLSEEFPEEVSQILLPFLTSAVVT